MAVVIQALDDSEHPRAGLGGGRLAHRAVDRHRVGAEQLGELYRLRWRIELAFKRLKSLLRLDRLPAHDKDLARAWIFSHLIAALLIEDFSPVFRDPPP